MKRLIKGPDKILDGVCSGFANYFELDPSVMRLLFILVGFIFPISIVLFYFVSMLIIPRY
jgi:phage shock protein C